MPKKRTAAVSRDRNGSGLELWSRGKKGPVAQPHFNPSSPESMAALQRTLNQVPEVMVKVTGGGRDTGTAQAHIDYIDRHGQLDVHTDEGEVLNGKDVSQFLVEDWKLDTSNGSNSKAHNRQAPEAGKTDRHGKILKDCRGKQVHNIVLSMPTGTPPAAVLAAAQHFARENFALSHRYAMVLHDPATDPKHQKTDSGKNPHVHLVVKAISESGGRLSIRKATLQAWREQFAHALREQGIEANATPAAIRGKGKSSAKSAIHQHQDRLEKWRTGAKDRHPTQTQPVPSALLQSRVERVLEELVNGVQPDLTRQEKLLATRENVLSGWKATETALRDQGLITDANRVVEFIKNLPSVKTDHDLLKETMLADQGRLQAALGKLPIPPTHNKGVTPGDDLTLVR
jgi:hypothetical protein